MWRVEYNNDCGADDEGFWEWFEVTNGEITFKADRQEYADWLAVELNKIQPSKSKE